MMDSSIKEYVRLVKAITLPQANKEKIEEYFIKNADTKKEITGKHIAVASFAAAVAVGAYYAVKGSRQDRFNVR